MWQGRSLRKQTLVSIRTPCSSQCEVQTELRVARSRPMLMLRFYQDSKVSTQYLGSVFHDQHVSKLMTATRLDTTLIRTRHGARSTDCLARPRRCKRLQGLQANGWQSPKTPQPEWEWLAHANVTSTGVPPRSRIAVQTPSTSGRKCLHFLPRRCRNFGAEFQNQSYCICSPQMQGP